jgi:hypothetical protein
MTGWNMPPGCNVSDIPGNTEADQAFEAAFDAICEQLEIQQLVNPLKVDEEWYNNLVMFILSKISEAKTEGYRLAVDEHKHAEEVRAAHHAATMEWLKKIGGRK